ncbi:MAG: alpha/beta hydrolase, partial [Cellulosilyticaceae bacterium]
RWMIIIISIVSIILVLGLIVASIVYEMNFGRRYQTGESFAYTIQEFEGLERKQYTFESQKGEKLIGYSYTQEDRTAPKGLIVLSHGFGGGGHTSYMPEIDGLVRGGYDVFSYDVTGNDESGGKAVRGLQQGPLDLEVALQFVETEEDFKGLPIFLYGHSWGGYSVMSTLAKDYEVKGAIALSGFNNASDMIIEQGQSMYGKAVVLLTPFIKTYEWLKFGTASGLSSLEGLQMTEVPVLLIHSKDDPMISFEEHYMYLQKELEGHTNLHWKSFEDRGHECMRTSEVQVQLKHHNEKYREIRKQYGSKEAIPKEMLEALNEENKALYRQIDEALMAECIKFYDDCLE